MRRGSSPGEDLASRPDRRKCLSILLSATRRVRLDDEAAKLLEEIRRETGTTVSGALKRGLQVAAKELREHRPPRAFDVFRQLELGEGGYAVAPAREAKRAIRELLAGKRRRR